MKRWLCLTIILPLVALVSGCAVTTIDRGDLHITRASLFYDAEIGELIHTGPNESLQVKGAKTTSRMEILKLLEALK